MSRFDKIHLVSQSPRRRELLRQIGVTAEVILLRSAPGRPADVDETPHPGEDPQAYSLRVARAKAEAGWRHARARRLPTLPVLGADTVVVLDGDILGKPAHQEEAIEVLRRLSGRSHQVLTAVAVGFDGQLETRLSVSTVCFRALEEAEIRRYAASGYPLDKAGSYGIQGRAAAFVTNLNGSYSGVMGLPLHETAELLQRFEVEFG